MSRRSLPDTEVPNTPARPSQIVAPDDLLELWFALARREWASLAIVPAHPDGSTDELAKALAEVGKHLSEFPISALTFRMFGPRSVRAVSSLTKYMRGEEVTFDDRALVEPSERDGATALGGAAVVRSPRGEAPSGKMIIATPSVIAEPLGIGVARAADGVVLVVERDRTRIADVKRSIEVIGRERILGSCFVRRTTDGQSSKR